eukprot:1141022-Pelagomonas_calceolata.AAC.1
MLAASWACRLIMHFPAECGHSVIAFHLLNLLYIFDCTRTDNVRERAAANLGGLSKMSPRVDQLANDLAQSARMGDPVVCAFPGTACCCFRHGRICDPSILVITCNAFTQSDVVVKLNTSLLSCLDVGCGCDLVNAGGFLGFCGCRSKFADARQFLCIVVIVMVQQCPMA